MGNSPDSIDTWGELQDLFVITTVFLVAGLVLGAAVITANPRLDEQLRYRVAGSPNYTGGEIVFTRSQIDRINTVYEDSLEEFGWCLEVDGDRVTDMKHPLRLGNTSETHITFTCRGSSGILHTHPGALAIPELSATDQNTLLESDMQVSCVVSDPILDRTDRNPVSMNCFNAQLQKLAITIDDGEVA